MAADGNMPAITPVRVTLISLDRHLAAAVDRARLVLRAKMPGLQLSFHAASEWSRDPESLQRCHDDIAQADIIVASMLFMDDHIKAVQSALEARRPECDAIVGCLSAGEIVKLTRLGRFDMSKPQGGPVALLKRLRGSAADAKDRTKSGAHQIKILRQLPKVLKYVPGMAQDVRAYFLSMQYWLAASDDNIANMIAFLLDRYADRERAYLRGHLKPSAPTEYPDVGVYHPRLQDRVGTSAAKLPLARSKRPAVGLLMMRSYILSGDTGHYDGVIAALEARGLRVIPAFASGLDARPVVQQFFMKDNKPVIDALVSLTGFSLVGGPAYNDSAAAIKTLQALDVPYIAAHALEFQTLDRWQADHRGLNPVENTMMVAIPEIDGATGPIIFGGRRDELASPTETILPEHTGQNARMQADPERVAMLADRVVKMVTLRNTPKRDRKIAVTLFNFPPNGGGVGTAANLDVYASLFNLLTQMKRDGYTVDVPGSVDDLRQSILTGNAAAYGMDANVCDFVDVNDHIRFEKRLAEIEAQWGPAPGRHQTNGQKLFILGRYFGNVLVTVQPSFGYEGDPMRLLFEKGFAPTHAFAAHHRFLRDGFGAHAVLHFGTHGALEFMPGKQTGMSADCWPDYLIGDLPNFYLYAANNPSEAAIAKRRSAATTVSYLTPTLTNAGLYKGLADLKALLDRWRALDPEADAERESLLQSIETEAVALDMDMQATANQSSEQFVAGLLNEVRAVEEALIPHGLHVAGEAPDSAERRDLLMAVASGMRDGGMPEAVVDDVLAGETATHISKRHQLEPRLDALRSLESLNTQLQSNTEIDSLLRALNTQFVPPVAGGDLMRTTDILPTGRNIHGFDPFRLPSAFAVKDGARQTERLLDRHVAAGNRLPETVAIVLWGTDNLKSEGSQLAQALALIGARPRFDSYGRLSGAELVSLSELGRPRIDAVMTLSGIFRDLLPMQTRLLAEAAQLAAAADEPLDQNFVRQHTLNYQNRLGCSFEAASLRVFSNAEGAYGANVNQLVDAGCWEEEDELGDAYSKRKCFAYGMSGTPEQQADLLRAILGDVDIAYQNLESVELGLTTIDHYFDTLGGIGRAVKQAKGEEAPVYIGDQTRGEGLVRTLSEQVALESRTRTLNPKWYEGMLKHGYEGVRQIEAHVTNTMGWSATTGQVAPWVYQQITETFVLDTNLRDRMAALNPKSCAKVAHRLLEASDRQYWTPDAEMLESLRQATEDLEDRVEGILPAEAMA